jgi:subtilase family serine protease
VAPGAGIVVAISSHALVDAIGYLVGRSDVNVISLSVTLLPSARTNPFIKQARRLFKQAAAEGQTVLVASGDHGALLQVKPKRRVNPFAASPFVTAVGGTTSVPITVQRGRTGSEVVAGRQRRVRRWSVHAASRAGSRKPEAHGPDVALPAGAFIRSPRTAIWVVRAARAP